MDEVREGHRERQHPLRQRHQHPDPVLRAVRRPRRNPGLHCRPTQRRRAHLLLHAADAPRRKNVHRRGGAADPAGHAAVRGGRRQRPAAGHGRGAVGRVQTRAGVAHQPRAAARGGLHEEGPQARGLRCGGCGGCVHDPGRRARGLRRRARDAVGGLGQRPGAHPAGRAVPGRGRPGGAQEDDREREGDGAGGGAPALPVQPSRGGVGQRPVEPGAQEAGHAAGAGGAAAHEARRGERALDDGHLPTRRRVQGRRRGQPRVRRQHRHQQAAGGRDDRAHATRRRLRVAGVQRPEARGDAVRDHEDRERAGGDQAVRGRGDAAVPRGRDAGALLQGAAATGARGRRGRAVHADGGGVPGQQADHQ
mmetsp:Transcript_137/g.216  ORF Transcript_137/g.216 Transcript_137/m.216 type:complete len:364 (+) Transcript_137:264-1355(+)